MIRCLKDRLARAARGPIRPADTTDSDIAVWNAQILALQAQPGPAFAALNRAVALGFRTPYGTGLSILPAFDPFRSTPEYRRLDGRLNQLIAKERQEVLRLQGGST